MVKEKYTLKELQQVLASPVLNRVGRAGIQHIVDLLNMVSRKTYDRLKMTHEVRETVDDYFSPKSQKKIVLLHQKASKQVKPKKAVACVLADTPSRQEPARLSQKLTDIFKRYDHKRQGAPKTLEEIRTLLAPVLG